VEKTQLNCAVLFPARSTMWRSEIHIDLEINADATNRRRRRFCLRRTVCRIYQGLCWPYPGYCACV